MQSLNADITHCKNSFLGDGTTEADSGGSGTRVDFGMNGSWTRGVESMAVAVRAGCSGMASVAMTVRALGQPDLRPLHSEPPGQEKQ